LLDSGIGFAVGRFDSADGPVSFVRAMMKAAVSKGSAELLVEEEEEQGDGSTLVGETVGIAFAVALDETVSF
jgi:hypothetical protein